MIPKFVQLFIKKLLTFTGNVIYYNQEEGNTTKEKEDNKMTIRQINFDMDGTIANLYGVEGWLNDLINQSVRPYAEAKPIGNFSTLARLLNKLQRKGYRLCVITWLAKNSSKEYMKAVAETKRKWLAKRLPSVKWDEINIVEYGTPKQTIGKGILFDDEIQNRTNWEGEAYDVTEIIEILKGLN